MVNDRHGFAGISRRSTSGKPIIAAVHGGAYGGGTELVLNCDLVVASDDAVFALPEVKRGVVAVAGGSSNSCTLDDKGDMITVTGMPRLARIAGHQVGRCAPSRAEFSN